VVTALATTPVKGLRLLAHDAVKLTEFGVPDNRCFYLIDERGRMVNAKLAGSLTAVVASVVDGRLALRWEALVAFHGHVGRCLVTGLNPGCGSAIRSSRPERRERRCSACSHAGATASDTVLSS
jgi:hypothetical protein